MTANQIAYAGVTEEKRHNVATEGEVGRHNVMTEALTKQANEIQERKNVITEELETRKLEYQKQYNEKYLEWQKADASKKNELQWELNNIKQNQVSMENVYHRQLIETQKEANAVHQNQIDELERHNKQMEELDARFRFLNYSLDNKRVEYQNTQVREANSIALTKARYENTYRQGMLSLEQERYRLMNQLTEAQTRLTDKQREALPWQTALTGVGSLLGGMGRLGGTFLKP